MVATEMIHSRDLLSQRVEFLQTSSSWSCEEMQMYQVEQLKKLLTHCGEHVPYFRRLFAEIGFDPQIITKISDIHVLPTMCKEMIKKNPEDFIAENFDRDKLLYMTSGGSTGAPLKIYMDETFKTLNHANTYYYLGQYGFIPGEFSSVRLHGDSIADDLINNNVYWMKEDKKLILSSYHIAESTVQDYVEQINQHKPEYIHAFPSAIGLLTDYIQQLGLTLTCQPKFIFSDCETLYEQKRLLIEEIFQCPVVNIYGHTEGSVLGLSDPTTQIMHIYPQVGVCELLDEKGVIVNQSGQRGEIVVTGFNNWVMPFIRYRTYDVGVLERHPSDEQPFLQLQKIEGRIQDYVINNRLEMIPLSPALFDYNVDWSGIDRFRVVQEQEGKLTFCLVLQKSHENDQQEIAASISKAFTEIFNQSFEISVEFVSELTYTRIGKYRYLDQRLNIVREYFGDRDV